MRLFGWTTLSLMMCASLAAPISLPGELALPTKGIDLSAAD